MAQIVQQPYNLFAQQKMAGYPSYQDTQKRVPGQVQGETPEQFAAGKQAANSQTGAVYDDHEMKRYSREKGDYWGDPLGAQKWQAEENRRQKQQTQPVLDGNSSTAGMEYLNSLYTSPQEEERLRKASVANQRILAIGDAIRHIGNIANTVNYAPAQQFNSPVQEEYARYERGKALRDAANARYYSYQQAKANQEARMKQLSDAADLKMSQLKFQQDKFNRQQSLNEFKAKNDDWYKRATIGQKEQALEIQRQLAEGRISLMEAQEALARVKTSQGGFAPKKGSSGGSGSGGGKYWAYDQEGNIHYYPNKSMYEQGVYEFSQGQNRNEEYKKGTDIYGNPIPGVRRAPVTSLGGERARQAKQKKGTQTSNTPPSRRRSQSSDNNNVPPSRRR